MSKPQDAGCSKELISAGLWIKKNTKITSNLLNNADIANFLVSTCARITCG